MPKGNVFLPLIADPKQPRSYASYLWSSSRFRSTAAGAVAFGLDWGTVRWAATADGDGLQLGLAGGVFAQFDMRASSKDLMNADYVIGSAESRVAVATCPTGATHPRWGWSPPPRRNATPDPGPARSS